MNIWLLLLMVLCLKIMLSYLFHFMADSQNTSTSDFSVLETIVAVVIVAPLIETLIFQFGIQELILRFSKITNYNSLFFICITMSSLLFSITHYDSLFHVLISFLSGLIYATLYILIMLKFEKRVVAIGLTSFVHSLYNLFEFLTYQ